MGFYSISFFALILFSLVWFWALKGKMCKWRIWLVLISSILFIWDNTSALVFVTLSGTVNVVFLRWVLKSKGREKYAIVAIVCNVLLLVVFKLGGASWNHWAGEWILPLGLSFYTFQHIASWVKVRQEDWDEIPKVLNYMVYTVYFPKMVSGPVEKWESFNDQLEQLNGLKFNDTVFIQGLRYILWGAFAKWTVAPWSHSFYVLLWNESHSLIGGMFGGVFNFIYVYAEFSGYSNFVMGISWLFGIQLTQNFRFPLFTNQVRDFWQRWHISFTQWILDYLFTPLTFYLRSLKKIGVAIAIVLSFLVVGLWHGLESNYIVFGLIQGLYFLPILLKWNWSEQLAQMKKKSAFLDRLMIIPFFLLMSSTALIFSSSSWSDFVLHCSHLQIFVVNLKGLFSGFTNGIIMLLIVAFLSIEWWNRKGTFGLDIAQWRFPLRWIIYLCLLIALMTWGEFKDLGTLYAHF
jgi:alginate O-acetyltransferase complex protein AlgI